MGNRIKTLLIIIIDLLILFETVNSVSCAYNINCFEGCWNNYCEYDPSTNSLYNSSISSSSFGYHGPGCCNGCEPDYFFFPQNKTCYKGICQTNSNGLQLYWHPYNNSCVQKCQLVPGAEIYNGQTDKPPGTVFYSDRLAKRCSQSCSGNLVANPLNKTCVQKCPHGFYLAYSSQGYVKQCSPTCYQYYNSEYIYGDDQIGKCVKISQCSVISRLDVKTYADNSTFKCTRKCSDGSFAHNQINVCVKDCFGKYPYENPQTNECVQNEKETLSFKDQMQILKSNMDKQINSLRKDLQITCAVFSIIIGILIIGIVIYQKKLKKLMNRTQNYIEPGRNLSFDASTTKF